MKETTKYNGLWMVVSVILAIMIWTYVGNVANRDESLQCPVFLRYKTVDLILPVTDDPQCNRLNTPGT